MKKLFILLIIFTGLFSACKNESEFTHDINPDDPEVKTTIVFNNSDGTSAVVVYSNSQRTENSKLAEIPAGGISKEIEWTESSASFYFSYILTIAGVNSFSFNYIPDTDIGKVSIDITDGIKNNVTIPVFSNTISSPDKKLSDKSFLFIENYSSFSLQLLLNKSIVVQIDETTNTIINAGDRGRFTITNSGNASSYYELMTNTGFIEFSSFIEKFESGRIYNFIYNNSNLILISEIDIILKNIEISRNVPVPLPPAMPVIKSSDSRLIVSWSPVLNAEQYEVYYSGAGSSAGNPKKVFSPTAVLDGLTNKQVYNVRIKAVNTTGSSDFSPYASGKPWPSNERPEKPEIPSVTPGEGHLVISWDECGGALTYQVFVSESLSLPLTPAIITEKTNAVIPSLKNDTVYYIWVRAVNNTGNSEISSSQTGIPELSLDVPAAPAAPVLAAGNSSLTASWNAVQGAAYYEIWTGTTDNSFNAVMNSGNITGNTSNIIITGLTNGTSYYVWIKAVNSKGSSDFSSSASAAPSAFAVPPVMHSAPNVTAGSTELAVDWTMVEGASFYEVWISPDNNINNAQKYGPDITGTSITITKLVNEITYFVWIRAKNSAGTGGYSDSAEGTPVFAAPPSAFLFAPAITSGDGFLQISWQAAERASAYEVWISETNNTASASKAGDDITTLSYIKTGLKNYTAYYIWVKAKNSLGASAFGPAGIGSPKENNITAYIPPLVINTGYEQLFILWDKVEFATSYEVLYSTSNIRDSAIKSGDDISGNASSLSATISGLQNGTLYYVWIKAKNGASSAYSNAASAIPQFTLNVKASNGRVDLEWSAIQSTTQYQIFQSENETIPSSNIYQSTSLSRVITNLTNGLTYYFWVKSIGAGGEVSGIAGPVEGIPLGNMGTVSVVPGSGQLTVNWDAVIGAQHYEVYLNTENTERPLRPVQTVSGTSAAIRNLTGGKECYIWVRPINANGAGNYSQMLTGTPIGSIGSITASLNGSGSLALSWELVAGAVSYDVYFNANRTMPASPSQTVYTASSVINGLTNGVTYYMWIVPKNAGGSVGVSLMTNGTPIASINNLSVSNTDKQIALNWNAVQGAVSYEVYHSTGSVIPSFPSFTINGTSHTFTGLTNGTFYNFWVKVKNVDGVSGNTINVSGRPIGIIGDVKVNPSVSGTLALVWQAVDGADQYDIYHSNTSTMPGTILQTVTGTTASIANLTNGLRSYIWVRPKNSNSNSNASEMTSGIPVGLPELKASSENKRVILSWTAAQGAASYEIYMSGNETIPSLPVYNIPNTSVRYEINNLTNGANYNFWIRSINEDGKSGSASSIAAAMPGPYGLYRNSFNENNAVSGVISLSDSLEYITTDSGNSYVIVVNNETIPSQNLSYSGRNVQITLMGYADEKIINLSSNTNNSLFILGSGVTLILDEKISITGRSTGSMQSVIRINSSGNFIMNDGSKITGNYTGTDGGGAVIVNGGTFTMNGGGINGCRTNGNGGAVRVLSSGTFTMNGGIINGNTANTTTIGGGGVHLNNGTFIMNGGIISGNTCYQGGGVNVNNGAVFTMNDGIISGNTAISQGGGVVVIGTGVFTMNGGKITKNNSSSGGGISIGGTVNFHGGVISGNSATSLNGGGIYLNGSGGIFNMYNGVISGNTARYDGGAIYMNFNGGNTTYGRFWKRPASGSTVSGIIYGSNASGNDADGIPLKNVASRNGDVFATTAFTRYTTVGESVTIDSASVSSLSQ